MRSFRHWVALFGVLWATSATTKPAAAQDVAAAEALFNRGVADLEGGHFDTACPALQESQRLDPRAGTLFALGDCEAKWGKLASAVASYQDYLAQVANMPKAQRARHEQRAELARAAVARLTPQVPKLALLLAPETPAGAVVLRDGARLGAASLSGALPIDPGAHVVILRVDGRADASYSIQLAPGETRELELHATPAAATSTENQRSEAPKSPQPPKAMRLNRLPIPIAPRRTPGATPNPRRTWGYVTGSVGLAATVTGAATGLVAVLKGSAAHDACPQRACSPDGLKAVSTGRSFALVSDIGFGVGAVGLLSAVILLWPSGHSERARRTDWSLDVATTGGGAGGRVSWAF